ncbi:hypothetical protein CGC45_08770 [Francisella opportunistica]|uniref:Uncharacterized protein n=1 Tax=Francisella opportunistica TaxID=2016517 RepID=A0A345JTK4_9GAMM|nr:hypothetical protein CGC43_08740 [Francisella opportunistica]AXH32290.1 hypothetical protein CGC44_08710 [Francisella opportunistica]AXH33939.1 hypothetical protein CGC45_08770 [Francisella opportunistica]
MTFLETLVIRHLFTLVVYSVYEIENSIRSVKPEYSKLLKAGLLNKDIEENLVTNTSKINTSIWLGVNCPC